MGDESESLDRLWEILRPMPFTTQVNFIKWAVSPSKEHSENLKKLCRDLRDTLHEIWPGCRVNVFGSVLTGLAFQDSDLDSYIELPADADDDAYNCAITTKHHFIYTSNPFEYVASFTARNIIPVITIKHTSTGLQCDVTFNGAIAVYCGRVIRYLLRLDLRASKLAFLVKYWARIYGLTTTKQLSNNVITLLVITFLQQKKLLPSVKVLQEHAEQRLTEGWNTAFAPIDYTPQNSQPLYRLLGEFFQHYSNFNFGKFIVCPFLGCWINRVDCGALERAQCRELQPPSDMNVQDLFEHSSNCAATVPHHLARRLARELRSAAACYATSGEHEFLFNLLFSSPLVDKHIHRMHCADVQLDPRFIRFDPQIPKKGRPWCFYFCIVSLCILVWASQSAFK